MKYYTKPGVIPVSCCDMYYLVTSEEKLEINETAAFYWKCMENGADAEQMAAAVKEYYELDDTMHLQDDIENFIALLLEKRLLISVEE